ncbi:hypothetical protein EVAR_70811_1 [Eumeta japonica]|uniref:Uncharacterized protein n=1 Tax=Eumeta variegata TaxID=151549 RepID=A0A4C1TSJ7_EUMVA|nr:hypothetical protein EVAR_70811_1 [Eumeta japonica]
MFRRVEVLRELVVSMWLTIAMITSRSFPEDIGDEIRIWRLQQPIFLATDAASSNFSSTVIEIDATQVVEPEHDRPAASGGGITPYMTSLLQP